MRLRTLVPAIALVIVGCGGAGVSGGDSHVPLTEADLQSAVLNAVAGENLFDLYSLSITNAMSSIKHPGMVFRDSNLNLYYTLSYSGLTTTISYFTDAAATKPAGLIVMQATFSGLNLESYTANVNVTAGKAAASGSLSFANYNAALTDFGLQGSLVTPTGPDSTRPVTWTFNLQSDGWTTGTLTGSYSATQGADTVTVQSVVQTQNSAASQTIIKAKVLFQPQDVFLNLVYTISDSNGSAQLSLDDGTRLSIDDADGTAWITFPGGLKLSVPVPLF